MDDLVPDYLCPLCLCDSDDCLCDLGSLSPSRVRVRAFAYGHWGTMHKRRFSFSRHKRHGAKQLLNLRREQRKLFACEGWIATLPEISGLIFWADCWDMESRRQQIATWDCPF